MVLRRMGVGWKTGSSREACFDDCAHSCNPGVRFRRGSCLHELVNELELSQGPKEPTITASVLW
jgi:hypothetical protein